MHEHAIGKTHIVSRVRTRNFIQPRRKPFFLVTKGIDELTAFDALFQQGSKAYTWLCDFRKLAKSSYVVLIAFDQFLFRVEHRETVLHRADRAR